MLVSRCRATHRHSPPSGRARRALLAPGGYTIAVLTPPGGPAELAQAAELLPAAHRCGLGYLQHIVAVTAALDRDRLTIPDQPPAVRHLRVHIDLLVLVLHAGRHA